MVGGRGKAFSDLLGGDEDLGDRVAPVVRVRGQVGNAVDTTLDVDEPLARSSLQVAAVHLAGGAGDVSAELVVGLSTCHWYGGAGRRKEETKGVGVAAQTNKKGSIPRWTPDDLTKGVHP